MADLREREGKRPSHSGAWATDRSGPTGRDTVRRDTPRPLLEPSVLQGSRHAYRFTACFQSVQAFQTESDRNRASIGKILCFTNTLQKELDNRVSLKPVE